MLENITLKFTENGDVTIPIDGITVIVGPNNSGKSLILREIEQAVHTYPFPTQLQILRDYAIRWPESEKLEQLIQDSQGKETDSIAINQVRFNSYAADGGRNQVVVDVDALRHQVAEKIDPRWVATQFLRVGFLRLDGRSRFALTNDQTGGDLTASPANVLAHLFQNDSAREKVRELVFDAFGVHFVIDPTQLGKLRMRLSEVPPKGDEQSLNSQAREFHRAAKYIKDASDGVQAYTGILSAVLSGEYSLIAIDEPEAFLHPPLARKLGAHLTSVASQRSGSLIAATHSADFLMGCIQATPNVRVLRVEYHDGKSRGRIVDPTQLEALYRKPLLRSANVISGLFHDGVVVTESDNDRVLYSEIYHRLSSKEPGYPSVLFVNAQNKQTIREILGPLRTFGVPATAIADIDIVKDGGSDWSHWLSAAHVPAALHGGLALQRDTLHKLWVASGKNMKTQGGIDILSPQDKAAANQLFDVLQSYGVFVVRKGELESWLTYLGASSTKSRWAANILERLGSNPSDSSYVKPRAGDIWDFVRGIATWIKNPARFGTD